MGFSDWMARKGNVGGTARAVANAWKTIKLRNPEMNNQQIAETYISIRYGATKEPHLATGVFQNLTVNKRAPNPLNVAWAIFCVENTGEVETILDHMVEWKQMMREEIEKLGIDAE